MPGAEDKPPTHVRPVDQEGWPHSRQQGKRMEKQREAMVSVTQVAGHIRHFISFWQTLTDNAYILDQVRGLTLPSVPPQWCAPVQHPLGKLETEFLHTELSHMLQKGIIEQAPLVKSVKDFSSTIFLRPKRDGGFRLILNLKQFNSAFNKKHFKMDTFQDICQLVDRDDYMTSVDLKDAYYSVNVKFCHRMKLQFSWAGTRYQFTCLPNGYWDGLCMFTKILKPVLAHVHHSQGNVLMYLDDS